MGKSVMEDTPNGPKIVVHNGFAHCQDCGGVNRCYCRAFYLLGHKVKCKCEVQDD